MATPLSLSQSSFLLSSLVASPPHRLDARPLLSYRPLLISPPVEAGAATISLGSTSITAKVSTQVIKSSTTTEDTPNEQQDEAGGPGGQTDEDHSAGVWSVSVGVSPTYQPPVLNGGKNSRTGCLELDAELIQMERMVKRHLNHALPIEQFIILSAPHAASSASSSSSSSSYTPSSSTSNREKVRGATYWALSIDLTIHSLAGGNFYDAAWAAAFAAVYRTRLPRTREVAYIPPQSSSASRADEAADMEKMGIKSLKGEKKRNQGQGVAATSGRAVDFELVDVWDEGRPLTGLDGVGVGLTVVLLPNHTHLLDPSLDEELSLPTSRRVFLVVSPSRPSQALSIHLLPSLLNLTAGESDVVSDEDALRFPRPTSGKDKSDSMLSGVDVEEGWEPQDRKQTWEEQGWGLPSFQRVRRGVEVGSRYAVELGRVLRMTLEREGNPGEKPGGTGRGEGDGGQMDLS